MRALFLAIAILVLFVGGVLASVALFASNAAYFSLIALGLALALQKYMACYFSFFVITFARLFSIGDRIRIGNIKGDVKKVGLFHFVLDEVGEDEKLGGELTGRTLYIPNLIVLDQPVLNYSKNHSIKDRPIKCNFIFDEVRIPITPQSDVRRACRLLEEIITREDAAYLSQAKESFAPDYPNFVREAEEAPRTLVHLDSQKVWLKGKFVTPFNVKNDLKSTIYLRFLESVRQEPGIHLA